MSDVLMVGELVKGLSGNKRVTEHVSSRAALMERNSARILDSQEIGAVSFPNCYEIDEN